MSDINTTWERIEAWYEAQGISHCLNSGATPKDIARIEEGSLIRLPEDLKTSLLRHNGTQLLYGWPGGELLSIDQIDFNWTMLSSVFDEVDIDEDAGDSKDDEESIPNGQEDKSEIWNDSWLPIVTAHGKLFLIIDTDPNSSSTKDKIFSFSAGMSLGKPLTYSFAEYLQSIADELESGCAYVEDEEVFGTIWD